MKKVITETMEQGLRLLEQQNLAPSVLCVLEGPCMEYGRVNKNNRLYSKKLVENCILKSSSVQALLQNKSMLGEGTHPEERDSVSYPEVAIAVEHLWIDEQAAPNLLLGRFAVLNTPNGRVLETLVRYGSKIGISARAYAESTEEDGVEVISETSYELITFDAVPDPGFAVARLEKVESTIRPMGSMTLRELRESRDVLRNAQLPALQERAGVLELEIQRRETAAATQLLPAVRELASTVRAAAAAQGRPRRLLIETLQEARTLLTAGHAALAATRAVEQDWQRQLAHLTTEREHWAEERAALQQRCALLEEQCYRAGDTAIYKLECQRLAAVLQRLTVYTERLRAPKSGSRVETVPSAAAYHKRIEQFSRPVQAAVAALHPATASETVADTQHDTLSLRYLLGLTKG